MKWAAGLWGLRMLSLGGLRADVSPAPPLAGPSHMHTGHTDARTQSWGVLAVPRFGTPFL